MKLHFILGHFLCAWGGMVVANWFGLWGWRRSAGAHWTDRARVLWPARVTAIMNLFLIPVVLWLAQLCFFPNTPVSPLVNGAAAALGALLGCYFFDRTIYPGLDFKGWFHQAAVGWGARFMVLGAVVIAALAMPERWSVQMAEVILGYLAFHAVLNWGLYLRYLRWTKYLTPAGERLQRITEATGVRMGVRPRAVWQIEGAAAHAFAFPVTREMAVSTRLLEILDDEEVAAICAHEMAHLSESKNVLAGRLLGSLSLSPMMFMNPCTGWFGPFGLLLPFALVWLLVRFTRSFTMRMEKRADAEALHQQLHQGVYARALEKLYRENLIPAVGTTNRSTHPHLYDRMLAAGITPDYPRPARPKKLSWAGLVTYATMAAIFIAMVLRGGG